ncbi:uncharacterized protein LOC143033795 [Oratosquilla oratoria]|uniref:uncharacterized protein LOC143033795 n=1 Tax=Oratosquilla oratoria TaxID=337810 RepID=UPI003F765F87
MHIACGQAAFVSLKVKSRNVREMSLEEPVSSAQSYEGAGQCVVRKKTRSYALLLSGANNVLQATELQRKNKCFTRRIFLTLSCHQQHAMGGRKRGIDLCHAQPGILQLQQLLVSSNVGARRPITVQLFLWVSALQLVQHV